MNRNESKYWFFINDGFIDDKHLHSAKDEIPEWMIIDFNGVIVDIVIKWDTIVGDINSIWVVGCTCPQSIVGKAEVFLDYNSAREALNTYVEDIITGLKDEGYIDCDNELDEIRECLMEEPLAYINSDEQIVEGGSLFIKEFIID